MLRRMAVLFRLSAGAAAARWWWPRRRRCSGGCCRARRSRRCAGDHARGRRVDRGTRWCGGWCRRGTRASAVVEDPGTFAVRGAVIDLYPPVYRHPVRLELFGDEVESIRLYDAGHPAHAAHAGRGATSTRCARPSPTAGRRSARPLLAAADAAVLPSSKTRHLLEQIEKGEEFFGIESLAPVFHERMAPFFDYLPADAPVRGRGSRGRAGGGPPQAVAAARERRATAGPSTGWRWPAGEFVLLEEEAARGAGGPRPAGAAAAWRSPVGAAADAPARIRVEAEPNTTLRAELQQARADAADASGERRPRAGRCAIGCGPGSTTGQRVRAGGAQPHATPIGWLALLRAFGLEPARARATAAPARRSLLGRGRRAAGGAGRAAARGASGCPPIGWRWSPRRRSSGPAPTARRAPRAGRPASATWARSPRATPVVHDEHGVGPLPRPQEAGRARGGAGLPAPRVRRRHRLRAGLPDRPGPPLRRAARRRGPRSTSWAARPGRRSGGGSRPRRARSPRSCCSCTPSARPCPATPSRRPTSVFHEFEETFPFEETPDQAKAIEAVLADMQNGDADGPADLRRRRLRQDRGGAAGHPAGGRWAASRWRCWRPTTVLAEQHFVTFSERLRDFPVRVAVAVALPQQGRAAEDGGRRWPRASWTW